MKAFLRGSLVGAVVVVVAAALLHDKVVLGYGFGTIWGAGSALFTYRLWGA